MATGPRLVKAELATLLSAKPALSGVNVYTYTATEGNITTRDYIILGNVTGRSEPDGMGGAQLVTYTVECETSVSQPGAADTSDRGWAILNAVAEVLASDWKVNDAVLDAQLSDFEIEETVDAESGRRVDIEFKIEIRDDDQ